MRNLLRLNAALALLLEIALLVALVAIGLLLPAPSLVRIVTAVVLPLAAVAVQAVLLAPRSPRRLAPGSRLIAQTVLLAVAVFGLAALGQLGWAVALAAVAAFRIVLGARLGRV